MHGDGDGEVQMRGGVVGGWWELWDRRGDRSD